VPDIYQGTEIWDWSLVDPDNRRPVDYVKRRRLLDEVKSWGAGTADSLPDRLHQALDLLDDGRCKLYVIGTALEFRRARAALFRDGSYVPLRVVGKYAVHVLAFARKLNDAVAVVAVPRLCSRLLGDRNTLPLGAAVWLDTRIELPRKLAASAYRNLLDGRTIPVASREGTQFLHVADLMANWPCTLLTS
jgi:(1->4)-alpha-D-glucan 1-alpha-D-glucosylmutase